jgi:(2Fe-2S) ferredoxin
MSYYKHHVFFCLNQRDDGRPSCAGHPAAQLQAYAKERVKKLGLSGPSACRINKAGCMDRCEQGPVMAVYPDATWYTFVDEQDIDEIIDSHLVGGKPVERLMLK